MLKTPLSASESSDAVANLWAAFTAVARENHASKPGGSATPRAAARFTADSTGPRIAAIAKAITSPEARASGPQYGSPASRVYAVIPSA